jgi:CIC family chloride channel protein
MATEPADDFREAESARFKSAERRAAALPVVQPLVRRLLQRISSNEDTRFLLLVTMAATLAGLLAMLLRYFIEGAQALLFLGRRGNILDVAYASPPWLLLAAPLTAAVLGGILSTLARRYAGGSNVATIMEAVSIRRGVVRVTGVIWRAIASAVTIAGGGSVGREGPIVALGSAAASRLGRLARLSEERLRILVAAGAAAGFAAAYNTPIAGTVFVLEIVVGSFAVEVLGPVALAAVVAKLVAHPLRFSAAVPLARGFEQPMVDQPLYDLGNLFKLESGYEMLFYFALGLAAAAAGAIFLETLHWAETLFARLKLPTAAKAGLGGLVVGVLAVAGVPEVFGNGYEATSRILKGTPLGPTLAAIFLAKIAATCATVGSGAPGGVFTPTLLLGAALGGAFGEGVHAVAPSITAPAGAYALVGMGAMLAATTRAPLVSVVFMFEVTTDIQLLAPLLLACVVASIAVAKLRPRSIYEEELERRGLSWEGSPEERALRAIRVRDVMRANVPLLPPMITVAEVVKTFLTTRVKALYIGDGHDHLLGAIDFQDAKAGFDKPELEGVCVAADMARPVPTLSPEASIVEANEALWRSEHEQLPVTEPDGRFLGILTRRDLLGAIDREILRRNVLLAKVRYRGDEGTVTDFFELPLGQRLEQVPVPPSLEGRTFAELDLRARFGMNVLAVVRPSPEGDVHRFSPNASDRVAPGDVLVVIGTREAVEKFKRIR